MNNKYILSTTYLCTDYVRVELDYVKKTLHNLTGVMIDNSAIERIINRNLFLISGISNDLSSYLFEPNIMRNVDDKKDLTAYLFEPKIVCYVNDEYDAILVEVPYMLGRLSTKDYFELDEYMAYLTLAKFINLNLVIFHLDEAIINSILNIIDVEKLNSKYYAYYMCLSNISAHRQWVKDMISVVKAVNNIVNYIVKHIPIAINAQTPMITKIGEHNIEISICVDARAIAWEENKDIAWVNDNCIARKENNDV